MKEKHLASFLLRCFISFQPGVRVVAVHPEQDDVGPRVSSAEVRASSLLENRKGDGFVFLFVLSCYICTMALYVVRTRFIHIVLPPPFLMSFYFSPFLVVVPFHFVFIVFVLIRLVT